MCRAPESLPPLRAKPAQAARPQGALFGMLRYRADLRTLAFCALYFGVTAAAWRHAWSDASYAAAVGTFLTLTLLAFQGCVVVHNSAHCPPFTRPGLNACWCALAQRTRAACARHR